MFNLKMWQEQIKGPTFIGSLIQVWQNNIDWNSILTEPYLHSTVGIWTLDEFGIQMVNKCPWAQSRNVPIYAFPSIFAIPSVGFLLIE